jgi:hypothetical protein
MIHVLLNALVIALVVAVLALAREVRFRKSIQNLLRRLLTRWRTYVTPQKSKDYSPVDRTIDSDERL